MKPIYDIIVVGSGPSGVNAAYPLVKKGLHVAMIDGGLKGDAADVFHRTNQLLKISSNIKINQSLAKGGLSEIWPGICDYFTAEEITRMGLPADEIIKEYKEIAKLINLKLKPDLDPQGKLILKADRGAYQLPLAHPYRTSSVVDTLNKFKNFEFISNQLIVNVKEEKKYVGVQGRSLDKKEEFNFKAKILILAAGSLNTTRILLRSFNLYNYKTPFLTKCNYMFVCLQPKSLTERAPKKIGIGQVAISNNDFFIQFYRPYNFKNSLPFIPLPERLSSLIFSVLAPYLVIVDIRFQTLENKKRFMRLKKNRKGDILEISFHQTDRELQAQKIHLNRIRKTLLHMGLIPLKMLQGDVTSHYANGIPSQKVPAILSADQNGKLHRSKRIYIADASTWRSLPAKPPTLTIMANALRIGKYVLKHFKYD